MGLAWNSGIEQLGVMDTAVQILRSTGPFLGAVFLPFDVDAGSEIDLPNSRLAEHWTANLLHIFLPEAAPRFAQPPDYELVIFRRGGQLKRSPCI